MTAAFDMLPTFCPASGKQCFATETLAKRHASGMRSRGDAAPAHVHECYHCGSFHLTTKSRKEMKRVRVKFKR